VWLLYWDTTIGIQCHCFNLQCFIPFLKSSCSPLLCATTLCSWNMHVSLNLDFGPKLDKIKKNLQKSTLAFNKVWNSEIHHFFVENWVSSCFDPLFFFLTTSNVVMYIFTTPPYTTTIITSNFVHKMLIICWVSTFHTNIE
jgi:hypothetical protein